MVSGRRWAGPERTAYLVNVEVQKAFIHRRPFWKNIYSGPRVPPRDTEKFMSWLRHVCDVKGVRLPATLAVFRSQAENEDARFHFIIKVHLSDEGYFILKRYAGDRGIPHSKRNEDFAWKYNSLPPDNRVDMRRAVPGDLACRASRPAFGRIPPPPAYIPPRPPKPTPPPYVKPQPPVVFQAGDQASRIRPGT